MCRKCDTFDEPTRKEAREQALAKLRDHKSVSASLTPEALKEMMDYTGPEMIGLRPQQKPYEETFSAWTAVKRFLGIENNDTPTQTERGRTTR